MMGFDEEEKGEEEEAEEKVYVTIPESSIHSMLEFREISPDVLTMLSEDCSYMVRQVIYYASQFMYNSGRCTLTTKDVDNALNMCNGFQTFGHNEKKPLEFKRIQKYFVTSDPRIDILHSMTNSEVFRTSLSSSVNVQWTAMGKVPASISGTKNTPGQLLDRMIRIGDRYVTEKSGMFLTADDIKAIPADLVAYYQAITDAVMSNDKDCASKALMDLRQNPKICPLLPYFFTFVDEEVRLLNHEMKHVQKLFDVIKALMANSFMYLGHEVSLDPLIRSVLYCIIEPQKHVIDLAHSHWDVRDAASELLKSIIDQWATPVNSQYEHTLPRLKKVFIDLNKPLWSLYGAIVGITSLGPDAIEEALHPYIPKLKRHIDKILHCSFEAKPVKTASGEIRISTSSQDGSAKNIADSSGTVGSHLKRVQEAQRLHVALFNAAEVYMKCKNDQNVISRGVPCLHKDGSHFYLEELSRKSRKPQKEVYKELLDHFGEAIASRLPLSNLVIYEDNSKEYSRKRKICPSTCTDAKRENPEEENDYLPPFLDAAAIIANKAKKDNVLPSGGNDEAGGSSSGVGCDEEMDYEDDACDEECEDDNKEEIDDQPINSCQIKEGSLKVIIRVKPSSEK